MGKGSFGKALRSTLAGLDGSLNDFTPERDALVVGAWIGVTEDDL